MLAEVPLVFVLVGVAAYTVLGGADFGAGFWTLFPGRSRSGSAAIRDHARHAIGPVWEANHVWLIFVLVVCWTAYPVAYASIVSTLSAPLFIAAVGIILRGAAYAVRGQLEVAREQRFIERVFALSSVLTPFAFGTIAGAIASGRVPVGNATGDLVTSWLNPTSVMVGALAVATSGYLAAVYLAADARRLREPDLEHDFRLRALGAGVVAGALAVAGLAVVHGDARAFWHGLAGGVGLAMVIVSGVAGLVTLALVWLRRFGPARASAALAVAAIVAGWAAAQRPYFLPGLTVDQAAAGRSTLIAVIVAVAIGAVVLVPALALLFWLFLRGHLDTGLPAALPALGRRVAGAHRPRLVGGFATACLLAGVALMIFAEPGWTTLAGMACLSAAAVAVFGLVTVEEPNG